MSNLKKYLNDLLVFYTEYFEHPYHVNTKRTIYRKKHCLIEQRPDNAFSCQF